MILADKIIQLRKKNGWSQEELAEQMNVSRQAVCKWEGAQSIPDINKLIQLSKLFNVSLDYLLKDEVEEFEYNTFSSESEPFADEQSTKRFVSMEEANAFLKVKEETSGKVAFGVSLCILSMIPLFLLASAAENYLLPISEDMAGGIGLVMMLVIVAPAVAIFIQCGMKTSPYEYLEKEPIETQYGVTGMVKERRDNYRDTYMKNLILGVIICILSAVPLFSMEIFEGNEFDEIVALCIMFAMVSIGVAFIVKANIPWESMKKLLQEGDYSVAEKERKRKRKSIAGPISGIYWMLATAFFLILTFAQPKFFLYVGGMFWAVAGILFVAVLIGCKLYEDGEKK
ncbi:MAG: helix-turn-helix transcriptional regulator [Agathobacter sp.]|nr:helix-turn-helix transcriptional regulator [Agathobacter sp.]